ncbi:MAG: murein biosynthesis integral membrane protein MurJ [Candidatus Methylacidiphilales bacterium]|nr:murein biosynthesis integral membrane protein MurJ [Candidatus Methylacidiphilales bacterium]
MSSTARPASRIMLAVLGSRVLGLVREVILNSIFGAGKELDAFLAAFRIPNLLRDLFAEGALSTAFVTTFSKKLATEGQLAAFRLANLVNTLAIAFMAGIVVLGILGSEGIVSLIGWGLHDDPYKFGLTVDLTRILFPFIFFVSLAAVWMGLLNSLGSFGLPASASTAFNLVSILCGLGLGWWIDPHFGPKAIYGFALGTVLGGVAQWVIQVPKARSLGYHFQWTWDWRDPGLRQVLTLMAPAIVGGAAVQVNVLVNTSFALLLQDGSVTWLNNAFRLMQLPIGLFGVAIATVTLPSVSRSAALEDLSAFRTKLSEGLRLASFLTLPASVGLILLAVPIIGLIYQRGAFTASDTLQTALALQAYAIGLAPYAAIKIVSPAFYALGLPRVPLRVSLVGIVLNLILNSLFVFVLHWGVAGLALSTALVALINLAQLLAAIGKPLGPWIDRSFLFAFAKITAATLVMCGAVAGSAHLLHPWMDGGWFLRLLTTAALVGVGCTGYFLTAFTLGLQETAVIGKIARRLRG